MDSRGVLVYLCRRRRSAGTRPILATLGEEFSVSAATLGLVAPAGTAGFVVAVVVTGTLAGRLSMRSVLLVGAACTAGSLIAMSAAPTYAVFLVALVGQGTAAGAFRGLDRVVLSHLYAEHRARMYTVYTLVWAVGAVLTPQLVSIVLAVAEWRTLFLVVACAFLPATLLAARYDLPSIDTERSVSRAELAALLRRPAVLGSCLGMILTGALEGILFTWIVYYAETFYPTTTANALLSVYLLAYIPARLSCATAIERVPHLLLLLVALTPAIPALAVAFSGVTGPALFATIFVAGAAISTGFPVLSAYAVESAPEYSGPLNAVTNGSTYVGLATAPAIVGVFAGRYGIRTAIQWTVVAIAVAFVLAVGALWRWTNTPGVPRHT
ncbi:sugar MFS transporter [Halorubrum saccharovorum]|uniref:MFS transporter n=1 Tax=Halorubrum saccharovorum TaxID=2248 RepID=UPI0019105181|nr:MFS transporter [Halorubrum saccharovorum]